MDCNCGESEKKQYHKTQMSTEDMENDLSCESTEREWEAHTEKYKNAYGEYLKSLDGASYEHGSILMLEWQLENHPKLCCSFRHINTISMIDED